MRGLLDLTQPPLDLHPNPCDTIAYVLRPSPFRLLALRAFKVHLGAFRHELWMPIRYGATTRPYTTIPPLAHRKPMSY